MKGFTDKTRLKQKGYEQFRAFAVSHMGISSNGGTPIAGWFMVVQHTIEMDDLGVPYFRKPPYLRVNL